MVDYKRHIVKSKGEFYIDREDMETGKPIAKPGDTISFKYKGQSFVGQVSDDSYGRDDDVYRIDVFTSAQKRERHLPSSRIIDGKKWYPCYHYFEPLTPSEVKRGGPSLKSRQRELYNILKEDYGQDTKFKTLPTSMKGKIYNVVYCNKIIK